MSSAFSRVTAHILSTRMGKLTSCLILHFQNLLLIKQVLHLINTHKNHKASRPGTGYNPGKATKRYRTLLARAFNIF